MSTVITRSSQTNDMLLQEDMNEDVALVFQHFCEMYMRINAYERMVHQVIGRRPAKRWDRGDIICSMFRECKADCSIMFHLLVFEWKTSCNVPLVSPLHRTVYGRHLFPDPEEEVIFPIASYQDRNDALAALGDYVPPRKVYMECSAPDEDILNRFLKWARKLIFLPKLMDVEWTLYPPFTSTLCWKAYYCEFSHYEPGPEFLRKWCLSYQDRVVIKTQCMFVFNALETLMNEYFEARQRFVLEDLSQNILVASIQRRLAGLGFGHFLFRPQDPVKSTCLVGFGIELQDAVCQWMEVRVGLAEHQEIQVNVGVQDPKATTVQIDWNTRPPCVYLDEQENEWAYHSLKTLAPSITKINYIDTLQPCAMGTEVLMKIHFHRRKYKRTASNKRARPIVKPYSFMLRSKESIFKLLQKGMTRTCVPDLLRMINDVQPHLIVDYWHGCLLGEESYFCKDQIRDLVAFAYATC